MDRIAKFILRVFGWKSDCVIPPEIKKVVMIVAPHTSAWDFVIGRLTYWASDVNIRILIKKESFFFPVGFLLRKLGGIPVDRGRKNNMVTKAVELLTDYESMVLVITPEGTRKLSRQWKKGFYRIAMEANVPIAIAFIDYKRKMGGLGEIFYPTGDYERDMEHIHNFYRDKTARHPELFNLSSIHNQQ
jgi:1-acyl-sn-glycerol-3-phosphate acyltransferase